MNQKPKILVCVDFYTSNIGDGYASGFEPKLCNAEDVPSLVPDSSNWCILWQRITLPSSNVIQQPLQVRSCSLVLPKLLLDQRSL
ncbi:hypothetical protein TNCV_4249751 [Trichonephila clavipes]|nr:hypothetical protein TNCV_4249751 [Trichonephila clavipes]